MASSLSHFDPASFSRSWNYDVFLSFRGEDTRQTFVDHLYSALVQRLIHTYKDDETLPRGESISPSLLKAIEESRISVIIFSKNYADSSWCLDELAYIMKCKDERGQIVMPIFYHVRPSDVRKQEGDFGKAFAKQELENNPKALSWRKALVDASNLAGWEPKHIANGHESLGIKNIVDTILDKLYSLSSYVNEDLVGMGIRLQDMKSRLKIGSGGVRMVGIWGVGGGGKTTLASSIFMEIIHHFKGHCIVDNICEESSKYGIKMLQEKILSGVLKTQVGVQSVEDGKHKIKTRLSHSNVLILLDDVDELDQLEALAGSHKWFGEGSRIIITTRDKHLLTTHKVDEVYHISLLSNDEALQLFNRYAYHENKPIEDYAMLSLRVVSYAAGLPLALKVLGSFLYDKDRNEWRSALAKLKDIPNPKIIDKLKISYDGLDTHEKEIFLDIVCFFRRHEKNKTMEILDACGFNPGIGVKVLIQKALISISCGVFDMHDLVQEMGHYIIRGKHPNSPEKHNRVWKTAEIDNMCFGDTRIVKANDKCEAITYQGVSSRFPELVSNMEKLRFLYVSGGDSWSDFRKPIDKSPYFLSNKLRYIYWKKFPANMLPESFQPTKLVVLNLFNSCQREIWKGYKNLPNLKVLDLTSSKNLMKIPDLEGLPCLERMIVSGCFSLQEIHPSIGYHAGLVFLDLDKCESLEMFPPIIRMPKLETLILSSCYELHNFPDIQTNMMSLTHLCLKESGIEVVPSSVMKYCTNLVSIDLSDCFNLKSIEVNFNVFQHLKELHLFHCRELEIPAQDLFNAECCLEVLSLHPVRQLHPFLHYIYCKGMISEWLEDTFTRDSVRIKFCHFPRFLTRLSLRSSNLVNGDIPSDISELSNLQVLDLSSNNFSRLSSKLSQLPHLKFLNLSDCTRLLELPDLPPSIAVLNLKKCSSLEIVGAFPTNYKWLWKISIESDVCGLEKVLRSMLQGNNSKDHFMSFGIYDVDLKGLGFDISTRPFEEETFVLQLPWNWYSDYSGFLICVSHYELRQGIIIIKQEMCVDYQSHPVREYVNNSTIRDMCYIPFNSLTHKPLLTGNISFNMPNSIFKVELVPRRREGDATEKVKDATGNCSEFWDEEVKDKRTFIVKHDSESFLEIIWHHQVKYSNMSRDINVLRRS